MTNELQQEYALRFSQNAPYRLAVWKILIEDYFSRWIPPASTVLDLGCGWGEFINQIPAAAKYGMDLNPDSRVKLAPNVKFLQQDCSATWELPDNHLDTVFTSNFFEHLPTKESLRDTLSQVYRCLRPGGRLICLGPNIKYLPGQYWDFWDHYLPLTELALREGMELAGFKIDQVTARFLPYSMSQGSTPPLLLLRIYLRCRWAWPLIGKQFLVIGRKPAA
jgi:SAM-dependent methyltransferase